MNSIFKKSLSVLMVLAIALFGLSFVRVNADGVEYALYDGEVTEGDYIIYYSGKAMNTTTSSNRLQYVTVTPVAGKIANPDASIVWHIAQSGDYWTIYNADAKLYAASTGTKNQATTQSDVNDKALWTWTALTGLNAGTYEFVNKNNSGKVNANLRNNNTYGFACYSTSTGGPLSLYKLVENTGATGVTVTFKTGSATYLGGFTSTYEDDTAVEITMPGDEVFDTIPDGGFATLAGWGQDPNGSVEYAIGEVVEFTSSANIYPIFAGSAVTITQALEICAAVGNTNTTCSYNSTGIVKSINGTTVIITDNDFAGTEKTITCYGLTGADLLTVGKEITVTGKLVNYNNKTPEFVSGCTYVLTGNEYFLVSFVTNGGNDIPARFVLNESILVVADPVKADFIFDGWHINIGLNDPINLSATPITCTLTLYAKWRTNFDTVKSMFTATSVTAALKFSYVAHEVDATGDDDTLNRVFTERPATSTYGDWEGKTGASGAVYAGNSAGGNEAIQLRNSKNSGIVVTTSGGKAVKVAVTWNANTTNGRTLDVYGKNTAYSSATDLYNEENKGTKLGSIVYGTSTELVFEDGYNYIGVRASDGAMWLDEILVTWGEPKKTNYESFDDLELQFKYEFDFSSAATLVAESGLYIFAGDSFVYDNDNPVKELPDGKKIVLVNNTLKASYIGGLEIDDMVTFYDKTVTAVAYVKDAEGNYYFNTAKTCSLETMIEAYLSLLESTSLEYKLVTALEEEIYK